MEYIIVGFAAVIASGLTLFSGFGLGTLLLPVFALFFPIEVAVGMTAIVHFLNNIFKLSVLGKYAKKNVVIKFGFPAIVSAFLGALVLIWFSGLEPLSSYHLGDSEFFIQPVRLIIGTLILLFALFELAPGLNKISFNEKYLPLGGIVSGFFGGLSGHQGALRSLFLLRCGLSKESFIATGIIIACLVDISRMIVYSSRFAEAFKGGDLSILVVAVLSAFSGVFIGKRFLKKVTMHGIQLLVSIMLIIIALSLISGVI
jgi:uncharacterized protein